MGAIPEEPGATHQPTNKHAKTGATTASVIENAARNWASASTAATKPDPDAYIAQTALRNDGR